LNAGLTLELLLRLGLRWARFPLDAGLTLGLLLRLGRRWARFPLNAGLTLELLLRLGLRWARFPLDAGLTPGLLLSLRLRLRRAPCLTGRLRLTLWCFVLESDSVPDDWLLKRWGSRSSAFIRGYVSKSGYTGNTSG
jgi:hypothetical protein